MYQIQVPEQKGINNLTILKYENQQKCEFTQKKKFTFICTTNFL